MSAGRHFTHKVQIIFGCWALGWFATDSVDFFHRVPVKHMALAFPLFWLLGFALDVCKIEINKYRVQAYSGKSSGPMGSNSISASARVPSQPLPPSPTVAGPAVPESPTNPITVLETAPLPPWPILKQTPTRDRRRSNSQLKFNVVTTTMDPMAIPMINNQPLDYEPLFTPTLAQRPRGRTTTRRSDVLEARVLGIPMAVPCPRSPTESSALPLTDPKPSMTTTSRVQSTSRPANPSRTASEQGCWEEMSFCECCIDAWLTKSKYCPFCTRDLHNSIVIVLERNKQEEKQELKEWTKGLAMPPDFVPFWRAVYLSYKQEKKVFKKVKKIMTKGWADALPRSDSCFEPSEMVFRPRREMV
ncbi:hypothetical protein LTS18_004104 [Coniosporium uncinatum]|uniref:Uncharacterized protein n=1 Tax=Coniosporium uncinatum TaxID=93489 RepID=A0ACC3DSG4_9PEZI|nr:hypothetical protein LTS18_004104 [Coniosporium uncinatum]